MNYYSWDNHSTLREKTGGGKARLDVSYFLKEEGYKSLKYYNSKNIFLKFLLVIVNFILFPFLIKKESILFVQYPHNIGQRNILKFYKKIKRVKTIFLIHDLESIRLKNDASIEAEDLKYADYIISLNDAMKDYIENKLGIKNKKISCLELWDYYVGNKPSKVVKIDLSEKAKNYKCNILIAGNLDKNKAGYLKKLSEVSDVRFFLMGDNFDNNIELKDNVNYIGSFDADTRINYFGGILFGLIWDGESIETCSGNYGKYLHINLPHKTSFYLSNKIPLIVWNECYIFAKIEKEFLGKGINSLYELNSLDKNWNENSINKENDKIKKGYYLKTALKNLGMS